MSTKSEPNFDEVYSRLEKNSIVNSRTELAKLLGLGRAAVTYIANKRGTLPAEWQRRFEDAGYNWQWVTTGEGPIYNAHAIMAQGRLCVAKRIIGDGKSWKLSDKDVEIPFHTNYLRTIGIESCDTVNYFTVQGDAMFPTLAQGDLCVVDTGSNDIDSGLYYLFQFTNGILGVRKVVLSGVNLMITCDNEAYPPVVYDSANMNAIGRIAGFLKKV